MFFGKKELGSRWRDVILNNELRVGLRVFFRRVNVLKKHPESLRY